MPHFVPNRGLNLNRDLVYSTTTRYRHVIEKSVPNAAGRAGSGLPVVSGKGNCDMKHNPQRALVITYSQTGQTEIYGRLIAAAWKSTGVAAVHSDVRRFDMATLASFDLIMVGVPVFYWDVPSNVVDALSAAPRLGGIPAAADRRILVLPLAPPQARTRHSDLSVHSNRRKSFRSDSIMVSAICSRDT